MYKKGHSVVVSRCCRLVARYVTVYLHSYHLTEVLLPTPAPPMFFLFFQFHPLLVPCHTPSSSLPAHHPTCCLLPPQAPLNTHHLTKLHHHHEQVLLCCQARDTSIVVAHHVRLHSNAPSTVFLSSPFVYFVPPCGRSVLRFLWTQIDSRVA